MLLWQWALGCRAYYLTYCRNRRNCSTALFSGIAERSNDAYDRSISLFAWNAEKINTNDFQLFHFIQPPEN